jgi:hypothetical protein
MQEKSVMAWDPIITGCVECGEAWRIERVRTREFFSLPHLKTTVYQSLTMGSDTRPMSYLFWIVAYFAVATPVAVVVPKMLAKASAIEE